MTDWGDNLNRFGSRNPSWKGGRYLDKSSGYIYLTLQPDDPLFRMVNSGNFQVLEHRYVMAQQLGRPLESSEIVHHINGIKDDNRPKNLQLTSHEIHGKVYWLELQERVSELEKQNKILNERVYQLELELTLARSNVELTN